MITEQFLKKVRDFAYAEEAKFHTPPKFHVDFTNEKGLKLAEALHANKDIVSAGTFLMDSMLGAAMTEGRLKEHVMMAVKKTKELFGEFPELTEEEKENILNCVREHHGAERFSSLESEICCNADCYRFLSMEGVVGGMKNFREMEKKELIDLFLKKGEEKWNVLSLSGCKKELEPQYQAVKVLLQRMKGEEK